MDENEKSELRRQWEEYQNAKKSAKAEKEESEKRIKVAEQNAKAVKSLIIGALIVGFLLIGTLAETPQRCEKKCNQAHQEANDRITLQTYLTPAQRSAALSRAYNQAQRCAAECRTK